MLPNAYLQERYELHGWFGFWYSQPFSEREIEQLIGKGQQKRNSINQKTTQQKGKVNAALNDEMTSAAEALDGRTGKAQNQFRLLKFRLAGPGKHWNVRGTGSKVSIFIILAHLTNWNAGEGEKGEKKRLQSKNKIKKRKAFWPWDGEHSAFRLNFPFRVRFLSRPRFNVRVQCVWLLSIPLFSYSTNRAEWPRAFCLWSTVLAMLRSL